MDEIPVDAIIRSRRRTIALEVTSDAKLIVRAPLRIPASQIERMIREKEAWIRRKMAEMKKRPAAPDHEFCEGELFLFLGGSYPLQPADAIEGGISRTDRIYVSRNLMPGIRLHLKRWYMREAGLILRERCAYFSMITGHTPRSIRVTDARRRWGSCTSSGGLNFSWCLVQAPLEIVDYVVVHELVHLVHHNHSAGFWNAVQEIMPDYERRRKWLRENERLLKI
jgi:predicted metal-dependent hydrolase